MGFLDRLRGNSGNATSSASAKDLSGTSASDGLSPQPSTSQPSLPENLDLPNLGPGSDTEPPASSGRLYNPYEGLNTAVDGRSLKQGYKLPSQPEFLFSEESTVHKRSWSENLTYYTGSGYVTGALLGGGQGAYQAFTKPPEGVDSARLRLNRLLNMSGRTGRASGNALGALGLFFSSFESGLGYLSDGRTPDAVNSVGAGFATGALFRSARGLRAAGVAGAVGAVCAGLLVTARATVVKGL